MNIKNNGLILALAEGLVKGLQDTGDRLVKISESLAKENMSHLRAEAKRFGIGGTWGPDESDEGEISRRI